MVPNMKETAQLVLPLLSMFIWAVYCFVKIMPLNTMLRQTGEIDRKHLLKLLFHIWLVGIFVGGVIGMTIGYHGSFYILMQQLLGWGFFLSTGSVVVILPPILRYEQAYKQKQQKTSDDIK
jgi:hypothetical protein